MRTHLALALLAVCLSCATVARAEVDSAARSFGGQTVVWVVAELDDSLPVGATGSAAVSRTKG